MPLAAKGFRVRFVSPARNIGQREGVEFVALQKTGGRMQSLLSSGSLLPILLRQRATIYHFQDPQLLPVALALKIILSKRIIYDAYEDFPSMVRNKRSIPRMMRPLLSKMIAGLERLAANCFDGVMTADPFTLRRLARAGKSRKLVFFNFPNLDFFPPPKDTPKKFDLVYRGGISARAGSWILLDAMRLLADRGKMPTLLFIGYFDDSSFERALLGRIHSLGLAANVEFRGRMDHEDMARALSEARIGVSPLQDTAKFRLNIPVKIFEYWACGLPVVASDLPPIRPFFRNVPAGILYQPASAAELAQSIGWLLDHPQIAARMGKQGRSAVTQRFNNEGEVRRLRHFVEWIVRKPENAVRRS
jgi:glycosyltransferase involved in cell wall biosynthesis